MLCSVAARRSGIDAISVALSVMLSSPNCASKVANTLLDRPYG